MKISLILVTVSLLAMCSGRKHHKKSRDNYDGILKKQTCPDFGHSNLKMWGNKLICGDILADFHSREFLDESCCLIWPHKCAQAHSGTIRTRKRLSKKDGEEEQAAPTPDPVDDEKKDGCMYCVHYPCNENHFQNEDKIKCILQMYLCSTQENKQLVENYTHNMDRSTDNFITKIDRRLKKHKKHHKKNHKKQAHHL